MAHFIKIPERNEAYYIENLKYMLLKVYQINQTRAISTPFIHNMCVIHYTHAV